MAEEFSKPIQKQWTVKVGQNTYKVKAETVEQANEQAKVLDKKAAEKQPYDIKVECWLPATVSYRVWATNPEEAADQVRKLNPKDVKYKLAGKRDLKLTVYKAYTNLIELVRNLMR